jgi:hypothetical protein
MTTKEKGLNSGDQFYFRIKRTSMKRIRTRLWLFTSFLLICCLWAKTGEGAGIEPFRWGMTLEELTQIYSKMGSSDSILREDPSLSVIDLPYSPLKSLKISRGRVKALIEVKKSAGPESIGKLFGYAYEGRFFCRVELFKQTPWSSFSEISRALKEKFPEGKVIRNLSGAKIFSYFEYRGKDLYVFSNEEGVYYFDPETLLAVISEEQKNLGEKESKMRDAEREMILKAP